MLRSDNGPQYSYQEFAKFASSFEFNHITSSPRFPLSNGQAERTVQTVKRILTNSGDLYIVLLSYRATPLPRCNLSPAELCVGRRLRTSLPIATKQLIPQWPYIKSFRELNKQYTMGSRRLVLIVLKEQKLFHQFHQTLKSGLPRKNN